MKRKFRLLPKYFEASLVILFIFFISTLEAAPPPVKNVIILLMDGVSSSHTTITRWYKGGPLALDKMVAGGLRTYSSDSLITDSAASATAYATGYKTNNTLLGVLPDKTTIPGLPQPQTGDPFRPVPTILEAAKLSGRAVGMVATSNVQDASPAAFSAHWPKRSDYHEIAKQQVYLDLDLVLGGGKKYLLPKEKGGTRTDGIDLIEVLGKKGVPFIETREELERIRTGKVWGLFAENHLAYDLDRARLAPRQPTLAEMTQKAIAILRKNQKGFLLLVEGSKIDWASHAHDPEGVISELLAFDAAVGEALRFAREDRKTLVLAFSDHGNGGLSLGNQATDRTYAVPSQDLLEPLKKATLTGEGIEKILAGDWGEDHLKKIIENYTGVSDLSAEEIRELQNARKGFLNDALGPILSRRSVIGWTTRGHTGEDLFFYAYGPGRPVGLFDNTEIAGICARRMGLDLRAVDRSLFVAADEGFKKIGAQIRLDLSDPNKPLLRVEKGDRQAELPFSTNILDIGPKSYSLPGIVVFAPKTGKVYVPRKAIDLIRKHL